MKKLIRKIMFVVVAVFLFSSAFMFMGCNVSGGFVRLMGSEYTQGDFELSIAVQETTLPRGENFVIDVTLRNQSGNDARIPHRATPFLNTPTFLFHPRITSPQFYDMCSDWPNTGWLGNEWQGFRLPAISITWGDTPWQFIEIENNEEFSMRFNYIGAGRPEFVPCRDCCYYSEFGEWPWVDGEEPWILPKGTFQLQFTAGWWTTARTYGSTLYSNVVDITVV